MRFIAQATSKFLKACHIHFTKRILSGRSPQPEEHRNVNMSDTDDKNNLPHHVHHDYTVRHSSASFKPN